VGYLTGLTFGAIVRFQPSAYSFAGTTGEEKEDKKDKRLARRRKAKLAKAKRRVWLTPTIVGVSVLVLGGGAVFGIRRWRRGASRG